jgi:hypothetical protein
LVLFWGLKKNSPQSEVSPSSFSKFFSVPLAISPFLSGFLSLGSILPLHHLSVSNTRVKSGSAWGKMLCQHR